jgi:hypothetical protein
MARDDLHFRLRIPEDLKLRVEKAAKDNHRSMTAEIVAALEEKFPPPLERDEGWLFHFLLTLEDREARSLLDAMMKARKIGGDAGVEYIREFVTGQDWYTPPPE